MSLIASAIATHTISSEVISRAKLVLSRILFKTLTSTLITSYIRRALRLRIWFKLPPESRALLLALIKTVDRVKSRALHQIVSRILIEIEIATLRGKALLLGVIHSLRQGVQKVANDIKKLLVIGLQLLNHPLIAFRTRIA